MGWVNINVAETQEFTPHLSKPSTNLVAFPNFFKCDREIYLDGYQHWLSALYTAIISDTKILNGPFPSFFLPLFQNESSCKTSHLKITFAFS